MTTWPRRDKDGRHITSAAKMNLAWEWIDTGEQAGYGWHIWSIHYSAYGFDFDSTFKEWKHYHDAWALFKGVKCQ